MLGGNRVVKCALNPDFGRGKFRRHPKDVWGGGGGGGGGGSQLTDVYGNYSSRINTPLDTNLFSVQT